MGKWRSTFHAAFETLALLNVSRAAKAWKVNKNKNNKAP